MQHFPLLPRQGSCNIAQGAGNSSWWLCGPVALQQKDEQSEPIVCRAKTVDFFGQGTWSVGQLELRQQTKSYISSRAASSTAERMRNCTAHAHWHLNREHNLWTTSSAKQNQWPHVTKKFNACSGLIRVPKQ